MGSDHCVLCHEAQAAQFSKTVHARLKAERYRRAGITVPVFNWAGYVDSESAVDACVFGI